MERVFLCPLEWSGVFQFAQKRDEGGEDSDREGE